MFVGDIANYSPFAVKMKLIVERASGWGLVDGASELLARALARCVREL